MFNKNIILTRVACLGNFTLQNLKCKNSVIINHQKNRVDYALAMHKFPKFKINLSEIKDLASSKFVYELFIQEERDIFNYNKPCMLIMDSFSELTDKMFINKITGSCVLGHWKDIKHTDEFNKLYEYKGLLDLSKIKMYYDQFFNQFIKIYGSIPIIFLNFPTNLDSRKEYKTRGWEIASAILDLSKTKYKKIIPINADLVEPNPDDSAVYHFSDRTYRLLAYKICNLNLKNINYRLPWKLRIKLFLTCFIPFYNLRRNIINNLWKDVLNV